MGKYYVMTVKWGGGGREGEEEGKGGGIHHLSKRFRIIAQSMVHWIMTTVSNKWGIAGKSNLPFVQMLQNNRSKHALSYSLLSHQSELRTILSTTQHYSFELHQEKAGRILKNSMHCSLSVQYKSKHKFLGR